MLIYKISDSIVFNALKNIKNGFLSITKSNGEIIEFGNPLDDLKVSMKIKDERFNFNLIKSGSIGLGESYMNGFFTTNNLSDLIELTARNIKIIYKFSGVFDLSFINFFRNKVVKNTKNKSKENIAKHYDLGNDFFSLWLDKTLTYSSAVFENSKQGLLEAQNNKYQKLINLLEPKNGSKILEIGCGWGGFAEFVGTNYDVNLDCITISKKQYEFAKERIYKCGLNEKVNIEIKDYRDLKNKYDHIASIEMIEAVGRNYLNSYFNTIKKNLLPSGTVGIQAITIADNLSKRYKNKQDFIQKYIFPGGFLPSRNELENYANINDLKFVEYNSYADHYANTLIIWRKKFDKEWDLIKELGFDLTFKRMWQFYLSYCEAGFKSKNIDLIQFSLCNK